MKVADWHRLVSLVVHIVCLWAVVCRSTARWQCSPGLLWLAQGLQASCGNTGIAVCVLQLTLLLCLSTFFRLEHTLHLFLSIWNANTHTVTHESQPLLTTLTRFSGKICLHDTRHKSDFFFRWNCWSMCVLFMYVCFSMCVCIFMYRLWVTECGFMITEPIQERKEKFEGV